MTTVKFQLDTADEESAKPSDSDAEEVIPTKGLDVVSACQLYLRISGVRKSRAALVAPTGKPADGFDAADFVRSLQSFGFKASFGHIKLRDVTQELCPLVIFRQDGSATLIEDVLVDGRFKIISFDLKKPVYEVKSYQDLKSTHSSYGIISKKLTGDELQEANGHWFFSSFKGSGSTYFQIALAAIITNFLGLTTSIFTIVVYDRIIPNSATESMYALVVGVILALGFDFLIKALRAHFIDKSGQRADLKISRRVFNRILNLGLTQKNRKVGSLTSTVKEFENLREFFNSTTFVILIDMPFALFFIYIIYLLGGPMAYIPLAALGLILVVGVFSQPMFAKISKGQSSVSRSKTSVLVEAIGGLETIRATGAESVMRNRYETSIDGELAVQGKSKFALQFLMNFTSSLMQFSQIGVIILGVILIKEGSLTQGGLIGSMILAGRTLQPMGQLSQAIAKVNRAFVSYRMLNNLMKGEPDTLVFKTPLDKQSVAGEIEFKNVSFTFEGKNEATIQNLSLKIPAGQKVAFLGKMGSGKSTLLKMISGLYPPTTGAILIDGVDIRQVDQIDRVANVGTMLQDSWLFSGTIRENVTFSNPMIDEEQLLRISKLTGLYDVIGADPQGFDLMLDENGKGLSGGQKQIINLTRAMINDPKILLLDEPTSSMDQASEMKVVEKLKEYSADKTLLAITHRNPILSLMDRVIVLEQGKVIADTTPEKLGLTKN